MRTFKCYWTLLRRQCNNAEFGTIVETSEYWMIYRGPGFLAVIWFGSSPTDLPHLPSASCPSFSVFLHVCRRSKLNYVRGGKGVGSQIKWPRESLALNKSFNTLWLRWNGLQCGKGRCWGVTICFKNVGFVENQKCHFLYLSSILFVSSLFFCLLFCFLKLVSTVGSSCRMSLKDYFISWRLILSNSSFNL